MVRTLLMVGGCALACAASAAVVKSGTLTVELAEDAQGAVSRLVTAHGADLAPATDRMPLFYLKVAMVADLVARGMMNTLFVKRLDWEKVCEINGG